MNGIAKRPTIVIVPGSFSPSHFYSTTIEELRASGNEVFIYDLPSFSREAPQHAATLQEDVMFFNGVLTALCDAGKDVVVLGHSYGGCVVSECVKGLTSKREGHGRVVGLIYLTAAVPKPGECMGTLTEHLGFDFTGQEGEYLLHAYHEKSARTNFSDLPLAKGVEWVQQMPRHSAASFQGELQYPAYKDVDGIAYILCTEDKCLPPDFQEQMIETARGSGTPVKVYELQTGHCPNASQPKKLAEVIDEAVREQFC